MRIRITGGDGQAWFSQHIGEVFEVHKMTCYFNYGGQLSFECLLAGRHGDAIYGTVSDRHCEVVDWDGVPESLRTIASPAADINA